MRIHTVVGNFCGTDTFAWDRPLNEVREGYLLAIHHAGAYGHSMTSNSNSRQRPPEVLVHAGKPVLIIPFGSRNASEDAKLFFGQAIQKTVA